MICPIFGPGKRINFPVNQLYGMNKTILLLLITCLVSLRILAQDAAYHDVEDAAQIRSGIQKRSVKIQSIRSSFEQFKHLSILENDIKSEGMFYFKRRDKLRWEYEKPFRYAIVMSEDKIQIKNEDRVSAFDTKSSKLFSEISLMMSILLRGEIFENPSFKIALSENNEYLLATLYPTTKELKQFLDVIYMYFDKSQLTVSKLKMTEKSGDYTLIIFHNKEINVEIPDSIFDLR